MAQTKLTLREAEAANLLLYGLTNRAIGMKMNVAESTIKVMLKSVYRKKKVRTRAEFAAKCAGTLCPSMEAPSSEAVRRERHNTPLVVSAQTNLLILDRAQCSTYSMQTANPLLTVPKAAMRLGVAPSVFRRVIDRQEIAFVRIAGRMRISASDLDAYLRRHRVEVVEDATPAAGGASLARGIRP